MKKPKRKIKVGIIFGGKSSEHEISLLSAQSVINALDREKYDPILIGIDKYGGWHSQDLSNYAIGGSDAKKVRLAKAEYSLAINPGDPAELFAVAGQKRFLPAVDVVFPVLHGSNGEDGAMQGLLRMLDVPFVGPDILGSAVGMDKDVTKRLLVQAGVPVSKFLVFQRHDTIRFSAVKKTLGLPFFVKPANAGSSVGVRKVSKEAEFLKAIQNAFLYDNKILIEQAIVGREIEVSVLGNEKPIASIPGEVIPCHDFYSYEAKYIDEQGAEIVIPASLTKKQIKEIQAVAVTTFKVLCLEGMARVDMFLSNAGHIYLNEVNTIPGFTKISMYPKLWEASGLSYPKLIDSLIGLALERGKRNAKLRTSFTEQIS